jgi:apolipoprotein N-acyltransferase
VKTSQLFLLSLLSGLLLAFSWFPNGFTLLIFIAFIPLLMVENAIYQAPERYRSFTLLACSYLTFFIWNIITTWWIKNASFGGAAMAILCNALLMSIVFIAFHNVKKRIGEKWGHLVFICFWITFEFLHLDWDLTYPWLTLGNVFANDINWIQWYEYTGAFGGSLWVLVLNVLIFKVQSSKFKVQSLVLVLSFVIIPISLSYLIKGNETTKESCNVVVVQPNIDPYNEKFTADPAIQIKQMLDLADKKVDSTTDYLLFPETALTEYIWENDIYQSLSIKQVQAYLKKYPRLKIVIGASTLKRYRPEEQPSATARKFTDADEYYDSYNTALQLDSSGRIQIYHKSRLVPGVEKMPFPFLFKYFENFALDLGGTTGSLGSQEERTVFVSSDKKSKTAPVICYESIYGEFVGEYIRNGAQFISIITNDGWWGDTPGYKQHLKYGVLRAVETRKWIARSANTGISCFINPKGELLQTTQWWQPAVIAQKITLNSTQTFYTEHGDYIARAAFYSSLLLLIYYFMIRFKIIKK